MIRSALALCAALLASVSGAATARDIVLTNDDGLTSNVVALYRALKAAGHDVIVSVPCQDQSGMGAAIRIGRPLGPLTEDCRNGAAKAGAPGAGPMTREGLATDFFYVDGTPVMALLYGLDVAAAKRWGHAPDLVLSGPNEGQNLGAIIISSGTVGNVQTAALRGIPAIALSAGSNTAGSPAAPLANPASSQVAARTVELLNALGTSEGAPLLPAGIALNVNFPSQLEGANWRRTKVGNWNAYRLRFVESMADDAPPLMQTMAEHRGVALPDLPGVAIAMNESAPAPSEQNDESAANAKDITVSALQAGYGAGGSGEWLDARLQSLAAPQRR
ncbi:5'/3'-nucleotidase SurE [Novosphingobium sp. RD2P27]|uniref:5'-nucleotidase n=1 Tax=Novosphingobium kalidii TaxID=3230299 RepID=A0ABV2CWW5_9SPHN